MLPMMVKGGQRRGDVITSANGADTPVSNVGKHAGTQWKRSFLISKGLLLSNSRAMKAMVILNSRLKCIMTKRSPNIDQDVGIKTKVRLHTPVWRPVYRVDGLGFSHNKLGNNQWVWFDVL